MTGITDNTVSVQSKLERQAIGQYGIFDFALGANMIMSARDVMLGKLTPGAFLTL